MPILRNKKGEVKTQGDDETRQLGRNKPDSGFFGNDTEIPAVNKEPIACVTKVCTFLGFD